jgi:hypothetical protein
MEGRIERPGQDLSREQQALMGYKNLLTEKEVLQEEIITEIPGLIRLLMEHERKPILKIAGGIFLLLALWFIFGWDAVASGVVSFIFFFGLLYWFQSTHQDRDCTIFVEMRLPGQQITTGDHSPYSKSFFTVEKRFAVWAVPNGIIRRGLFKIPGDQPMTLMPGTGKVIFVDYFDEIRRTCVLPRDMDVANIALPTNANPLVAEKLNKISEQIKLDKKTERLVKDLYMQGEIKAGEAHDMLKPIKIRNAAFMDPDTETRRDIFLELQSVIPEMREKLKGISNKIFLLADFMAARGIYQLVNRPMPENIRKDHKLLYDLLGLPMDYNKKLFTDDDD